MIPSKTEMPWLELKAKLKQRYGALTDNDLAFIEGKGEELLLRLEQKLGVTRSDAERIVSELEGEFAHVGEQVSGFTDLARQRANEAAEAARLRAREGMERMRTLEHDFEDYVRDHPGSSVCSALALGFLVGWALRR